MGWDAVVSPAYIKQSAAGGGTAILARQGRGAVQVPLPLDPREALVGRCSAAFVDFLGGILFVSYYGMSGTPLAGQVHVLSALGQLVKGCGLPFIIGGDWQVNPEVLETSKFPHRIGADIVAPVGPSNLRSGNTLDYFLVSRSIRAAVIDVSTRDDLFFSPHVPVILNLAARSVLGVSYALSQPKLLPSGDPQGPMPRPSTVDWEGFGKTDADMSNRFDQWYAGAELELLGCFGLQGTDEEGEFLGLGVRGQAVARRVGGRFRGSPDQLGLLGQRLAWAMRAAKAVALSGPSLSPRPARGPRVLPSLEALTDPKHQYFHFLGDRKGANAARGLVAIARRAGSFAAELKQLPCEEVLRPLLPSLHSALRKLAAVGRPQAGAPPLVSQWAVGDHLQLIPGFNRIADDLAVALSQTTAAKRQRDIAAVKQWARHASLRSAHTATKPLAYVAAHSASPLKTHRGELTPQAAADAGRGEWAIIWQASDEEVEGTLGAIMQSLPAEGEPYSRFFAVRDGPFVPIDLPSLSVSTLRLVSRSFRSGTAVGLDWTRLRHFSLLSYEALQHLALLLEAMEDEGVLPSSVSGTVAVALAKKTGGSRLIGVATSIYRLWSRARYLDVREALEARLARPFLAAAPQQGAQRAVAELALKAECAELHGHESAAAMVDISKFYETLNLLDVAIAADYMGIPRPIIRLFLAFYLSPRFIRVGRAWAKPVFPQCSIVAGCTWATVLIRCLMLGPAERFLAGLQREANECEILVAFKIYVDDLTLLMSAARAHLRRFIKRAAKSLTRWVSDTLKLKVAEDKLVCIASSVGLKNDVSLDLNSLGYKTVLVAPCLGADFSAGGRFRGRPALRARLKAAARRLPKLRWLRRMGGAACKVARGGIAGSVTHAAEIAGIPPSAMLSLCRATATSAPVQAVGASLVARLALGGERAEDVDPRVLFHNLPLKFIMGWLWEHPEDRQPFVVSWHLLRDRAQGWSSKEWWRNVRGPLSAAWAHLSGAGVEWVSPFLLRSRGKDLSFLDWGPYRSYQVLSEHVRLHLDASLLARHASQFNCDLDTVMDKYARGIDWPRIRELIAGKHSPLSAKERRALTLVATDGLWEEVRKWMSGFLPSGSCLLCLADQGTKEHRLRSCPGIGYALDWAWIAGEIPREPAALSDPALAPLRLFGWPPAAVEVSVRPSAWIQGNLTPGSSGKFYGDGSCLWPQLKGCESAAWSLILPDGSSCPSGLSSSLAGPTVNSFRGELSAAIQFFRSAGPGSVYVGDCKAVVEAIQLGVPVHLSAASSRDADLWSKLRRVARNRAGDSLTATWVKAHRSRASAAALGPEALRDWAGNAAADKSAKEAARRHANADRAESVVAAARLARAALTRLAKAASVGLDRGADLPRIRLKKPRTPRLTEAPGGHDPVPLAEGGWRCRRCRARALTKASLRTFRAIPCRGAFAGRVHQSHRLRSKQGVIWCGRCGAYGVEKLVGLTLPCPGRPSSAAAAQRLLLLRSKQVPSVSQPAARRLSTLQEA